MMPLRRHIGHRFEVIDTSNDPELLVELPKVGSLALSDS
jgi:hypothetical protein